MNDYRYSIKATWRVEPTRSTEIGERFLQALEAIADVQPEIGDWKIMPHRFDPGCLTIAEARKNLKAWVESNVSTIDDVPDPHGGYTLLARTAEYSSSKNVALSISLGGRIGDSIRFEVGSVMNYSDIETVTYPLFRTAFLTIITLWPPVWAIASAYRSDFDTVTLAPAISPFPSSEYHIPWLGYLSSPLTSGLKPPAGVISEVTADGGLVMISAEERLDPTNPEHMRRARAMVDIMIARAGNPSLNGYQKGGKPWPKPENEKG